jgi:hypothetical protein
MTDRQNMQNTGRKVKSKKEKIKSEAGKGGWLDQSDMPIYHMCMDSPICAEGIKTV